MPKITFDIEVRQRKTVQVTLDPTHFTAEFMADFRRSFYNFVELEEHAHHIAQLEARDLWDNIGFVEGYGPVREMAIEARTLSEELETDLLATIPDTVEDANA